MYDQKVIFVFVSTIDCIHNTVEYFDLIFFNYIPNFDCIYAFEALKIICTKLQYVTTFYIIIVHIVCTSVCKD